jgi:hypothetical protein
MLAITIGLAPVASGCFRLWALVFYQGGRRTTLAGKENPEFTPVQTPILDLLSALTWEHPREKIPSQPRWAHRTIVYQTEVAEIMDIVKADHYNTLSPDIELPCGEIAWLNSAWAQS